MKTNKKQQVLPITATIVASVMIQLFLSGKVIDYSRGTLEGGAIAAVGVLVIIVSTVGLAWLIFWLTTRHNQRETK